MNDYEMVVLYHPDLEIDLDNPLKKVEKILTDNKGKITKMDNWGKRKLAYTINKEDHAIYVYYEIQLDGQSVSKVESTLNIADEVLRYIITKPVPKVEESEKDSKSNNNKDARKEDDAKESKDSKADNDEKASEK